MQSSYFSSLPEMGTDEVFDLIKAFSADKYPYRANLAAGVYCTDDGGSWPLNAVCRAESTLHHQADPTRHDYLPIAGDTQFLKVAQDLVFFFEENPQEMAIRSQERSLRVASVQTVSGTGANHIGAQFLVNHLNTNQVWVSDPTWANHHIIWESVGKKPRLYPYYNTSNNCFDFHAMMQTLEAQARPRDTVVLHACAHNPTGLDPSKEQWMAIADMCQRKQLFPFFDLAYQGFASGDPSKDAWAIRYFYKQCPFIEMIVAQSFSKSFGLYGHRAGALHLVLADESDEVKGRAVAHLCHLLRCEISMAPKFGSMIVKTILSDQELTAIWLKDLQVMSKRIKSMRHALYHELIRLGTPGSWEHIINQVRLFTECNSITKLDCQLEPKAKNEITKIDANNIGVDWNVFLYWSYPSRGECSSTAISCLHAYLGTHVN